MKSADQGLNSYKKIVYSQWGEDGILEEIFRRIGTENRTCVEFGAGDGYECSNVWHLIRDCGWKALLMEPDGARYEKWLGLLKGMPNVKLLNTAVSISGPSSLDNILRDNAAPAEPDLLSIDIDSDDYHIFRSLKAYKPRVVILEHNPTIPPEESVFQEPKEKENFGSSARANVDLAHEKGYVLAAATHTNCIFVRRDILSKLGTEEPSLEEVFDKTGLSYVISAYNGSLYIKGANEGKQPAFGWIYRGWRVSSLRSALHAFAFGPVFNARLSSTLSKRYRPILAFFRGKTSEKKDL